MYLPTLNTWLDFLSAQYPKEIDLGLERIGQVGDKLGLLNPQSIVIIVGGTNGKGSTVTALESIYLRQGYRVGAFISPMLHVFNDQIHINGENCTDDEICAAFEHVYQDQEKVKLTPFEYHTLAALYLLQKQKLDIIILEIGLGGRYDAVNAVRADLCIITTIALDHMDRLGDTREKIAYEKVGIARANKPLVCGEFDPPKTLLDYAGTCKCNLYLQDKQFQYQEFERGWSWQSGKIIYDDLAYNQLATQNMSTALMAVTLLQEKLFVSKENIYSGLKNAMITGRRQFIDNGIKHIFDVAHNPAAVVHLKKYLRDHLVKGKTYAVFSMLCDKDVASSIKQIADAIDEWFVAPLNHWRAATLEQLQHAFKENNILPEFTDNINQAYDSVLKKYTEDDRIVIFGSFHTVSQALKTLKAREQASTL